MNKNDIISVDISKQDLEQAIIHAKNTSFIDNLRKRNKFVSFDSKIRGFLGEIAITNLLTQSGFVINDINKINDGENEDIDIFISNQFSNDIQIEVKTSLFPDKWRTLDELIENADIKIIKRENSFYDIKADICVQIYYNFYRQERDAFLKTLPGNPDDYSADELIEMMKLDELHEIIVAWKDKETLQKELSQMTVKTWSYAMRTFWKCPLKKAIPPSTLVDFLKNYKKN